MNKFITIYCLGYFLTLSDGREPFKPHEGSVPFLVYFSSRHRGLCAGTLLSRTVAITAAVCVTNPNLENGDHRSINVVTGTSYRHPRRGIRVQVTKILLPKMSDTVAVRAYQIQKWPAILILKRKIPDIMTEVPMRAIDIDYTDQVMSSLLDECLIVGWHFFYKGDRIYPMQRFLLQRNLRAQFVNIVKMNLWCDTLSMKFQKALVDLGYNGHYDKSTTLCTKDGMYGSPLICQGKMIGMLTAPDAQWTNCTGYSNIVHKFTDKHLTAFMDCVKGLFVPDFNVDWQVMKSAVYDDHSVHHDYLSAMYDKIVGRGGSYEDE